MKPIRGASNINPCPHCGHTWFTVKQIRLHEWFVECEKCRREYIKPVPESWNPSDR